MPSIPKLSQTRKKYFTSSAKEPKRQIHSTSVTSYYNSQKYVKFRNNYLQKHPLCEISLREGNTVAAEHIHHLVKWYDQPNEELRWQLLLDEDNVIAITAHIHNCIHYNRAELSDDTLKYIEQRKDALFGKYLKSGLILNMTDDINIHPFFKP